MNPSEYERRIETLETILRGDSLNNPGVAQNVIRLINDLYNPVHGVMVRLQTLENDKLRKAGEADGVNKAVGIGKMAFGAICVGIGFIIKEILLPLIHKNP